MCGDIIPPDIIEIIYSSGEAKGAGNVRCAGFEFGGRIKQGELVVEWIKLAKGFAAEGYRCEFGLQFTSHIEYANASGCIEFVATKGEKVAVELLDVDRIVTNGLAGVDCYPATCLMDGFGKLRKVMLAAGYIVC